MIAGGVLYAVASLLYPALSIIWLTLLLRFLQGIGFSSVGTSANAVAAKVTPPSRIGEGMSYIGAMAALGTAIGPTLGVYIWRRNGSPAIFYTLAAVATVIVIVCLVNNFEKNRNGNLLQKTTENVNEKAIHRVSKLQLSASAVTMLIAIPQSFILTYIILYGDTKGCSIADYFFLISAVAMMLARIFFGKSYDRYGAQKTLIPSISMGIVAIILLCVLPNTFGFLAGAILYGVSYGVATPVLTAESVRLAPEDGKGNAVAVYYIGYDLGIGLGALLWGVMIDGLGYNAVFLVAVLFLAVAIYGSVVIGRLGTQ